MKGPSTSATGAKQFPVGTKVDSSRIPLFKKLNRGEVTAVHPDGLVMVRWDWEGECLQHPVELNQIATLWDHLKQIRTTG